MWRLEYRKGAVPAYGAAMVLAVCVLASSAPAAGAAARTVEAPRGLLIGSAAVQQGGDTSAAGRAEAFLYTAGATGTVKRLKLFVDAGNSATQIAVGLYTDSSGRPGALLTDGAIKRAKPNRWNAARVSPVKVSSGARYWLAALAPSGTLAIRDTSGGGGPANSSASGSLTALPAAWASGSTWASSPASFYAVGKVARRPESAPVNITEPAVSGFAEVGETIDASTGSWTETPSAYQYQWQQCNALGGACLDIAGARAPSYALTAADEGATVRVVVRATNSFGSATAPSSVTGVVRPPSPPGNLAPPSVSGTTIVGEGLRASQGSWSGNPGSYSYQWERCKPGCAAISGATASTWTLTSADIGSRLRVTVTAHSSLGEGSASSEPSAVVEAAEPSCTVTVSPGTSLGLIEADVGEAANKAVVCLQEGSYGELSVNGSSAARTEYATVRAVAGKTVTVAGVTLRSAHFLAFEHLHFSDEANIEDESGRPANTDLRFAHDSWEHVNAGVFMETSSGPTIKRVAIEHDRFVSLLTENGKGCGSGRDGGQGVTNHGAEGLVVAYNLFKEISYHYIQGGSPGPEGMRVEYNTFLGPEPQRSCEHHDNVWQIWQGGENNTFSHNLVLGESHASPQTDPIDLIFENGAGGRECSVKMRGITVEDNLFVYGTGSANIVQAGEIENYTVRNNTGFGFGYGWQGFDARCPHGVNHLQTRNIMAQGEEAGGERNGFDGFTCTSGTCVFDQNISTDSVSACEYAGTTHCVDAWKPSWRTTTFASPETQLCPPEGYYQPKEEFTAPDGTRFSAGYEGRVGVCQGTPGA